MRFTRRVRSLHTVLLSSFLLSTPAVAELTKSDFLELYRSGFPESVLVAKIQTDGVSFEVNTDVMLEMKEIGVPNGVIEALLSADIATRDRKEFSSAFKALYSEGDFQAATELVQRRLEEVDEARTRALLVLTLLKVKDRAGAEKELTTLERAAENGSPDVLVSQLRSALQRFDEIEEAKSSIADSLSNLDTEGALEKIRSLELSGLQKAVLASHVGSYQADFIGEPLGSYTYLVARPADSPAQTRLYLETLQHLRERKEAYEAWTKAGLPFLALKGLNATYSWRGEVALGEGCALLPKCTDDYASGNWLAWTKGAVEQLMLSAPLSSDTMNWRFQVAAFFEPYEDFERLGDRILDAHGQVVIGGYHSEGIYEIVIDRNARRIYTRRPSYQPASLQISKSKMGKLKPFNLSFDEVRQVRQKGKFYDAEPDNRRLGDDLYVLDLKPSGKAPELLFSKHVSVALGGLEGEAAVRHGMRNIGQFVAHVVGNPKLKVKLVKEEPQTGGGFWGGLATAIHSAGAITSGLEGDVVSQAMFMAAVKESSDENRAAAQQAEAAKVSWQNAVANRTFAILELNVYYEIEQLLDLVS